jgi:hypothetical protein
MAAEASAGTFIQLSIHLNLGKYFDLSVKYRDCYHNSLVDILFGSGILEG